MNKDPNPTSQHSRTRTPVPRVRRDFPWRPATPCSDLEEDPSEPENWEEEEEEEEDIDLDKPISPLQGEDVEETMEFDAPLAAQGAEDLEEELNLDSLEIPANIWDDDFEVAPLIDEMEDWVNELEAKQPTTRKYDSSIRTRVINRLCRLGLIQAKHYPEYTGESSPVGNPEYNEDISAVESPILNKRVRGPDRKTRNRRSLKPQVKPQKPERKKRGRGPDKRPRKKRGSKAHPPSTALSDSLDTPCHYIEILSDDDDEPPAPQRPAAAFQ